MPIDKRDLEFHIKEMGIYQCLDCGKCTGACPVAETGKDFSPRLMASKVIEKGESDPYVQEFIWTCLTCGRCDDRCPSKVAFSDFIRILRGRWIESGNSGIFSHGGALYSIMRMMSSPNIQQDRINFIPSKYKTQKQGKILYFVGCLPYFDVFFKDLDLNLVQITLDSLKILDHCNIEPIVLDNEKCCGHDLFWAGDQKGFVKLAKNSYEEIKDHGAVEIITSCPECYHTFKEIYPQTIDNFDLKVTHIFEIIKEKLQSGKEFLDLSPQHIQATFKDSCRISHHKGISHLPRDILGHIPGLCIKETADSKIGNICCGNSAWVGGGRHSKIIQMKRLQDTINISSELLITSCPKCFIHLKCTMKDFCGEEKLEVKDMISLIADALN